MADNLPIIVTVFCACVFLFKVFTTPSATSKAKPATTAAATPATTDIVAVAPSAANDAAKDDADELAAKVVEDAIAFATSAAAAAQPPPPPAAPKVPDTLKAPEPPKAPDPPKAPEPPPNAKPTPSKSIDVNPTSTKPTVDKIYAPNVYPSRPVYVAKAVEASKATHVATFDEGPLGMGISTARSAIDPTITKLVVSSVADKSQAMAQGVKMGDILLDVAGKSIAGMDKAQVLAMIAAEGRPLVVGLTTGLTTTKSITPSPVVAAATKGPAPPPAALKAKKRQSFTKAAVGSMKKLGVSFSKKSTSQ